MLMLGEAAHGVEEALVFRNQLLQSLVTRDGFAGIALETGYAESLRIEAFIAGGPGNAVDIARTSFTSGFGNFQANADLISWMREYNRTAPAGRQLRFFGIDLSLGGPTGSSATAAPVECALGSIERTAENVAHEMRRQFSVRMRPLIAEQHEFSAADYAAYDAFVQDLIAAARRTGDARAIQCATVARQAGNVQRVAPPAAPGAIAPDAWRTLEARDQAMADNALWSLGQLGNDGRLLVFAHDAHVMTAPRRESQLRQLTQPPRSMGQKLRQSLGADLVVLAEMAPGRSGSPGPEQFGDVLRSSGSPPFLLDLRAAPEPALKWLAHTRRIRLNGDGDTLVTPATAFDAVIVQRSQSSARQTAAADHTAR
jgi:erythromycin esterase